MLNWFLASYVTILTFFFFWIACASNPPSFSWGLIVPLQPIDYNRSSPAIDGFWSAFFFPPSDPKSCAKHLHRIGSAKNIKFARARNNDWKKKTIQVAIKRGWWNFSIVLDLSSGFGPLLPVAGIKSEPTEPSSSISSRSEVLSSAALEGAVIVDRSTGVHWRAYYFHRVGFCFVFNRWLPVLHCTAHGLWAERITKLIETGLIAVPQSTTGAVVDWIFKSIGSFGTPSLDSTSVARSNNDGNQFR